MTDLTEQSFGSAATHLAGFCAVAFGWSPAAFWRATPAEVAAVVAVVAPGGEAPVTRGLLERLEKSCG